MKFLSQNNCPKFQFRKLIFQNSIVKIFFPKFQLFNLIFQNSILEIFIFQNSKFFYLLFYFYLFFEIPLGNRFPNFANLFLKFHFQNFQKFSKIPKNFQNSKFNFFFFKNSISKISRISNLIFKTPIFKIFKYKNE